MGGTEESLEKSPETPISSAAVHGALVSRIIVKTEILVIWLAMQLVEKKMRI